MGALDQAFAGASLTQVVARHQASHQDAPCTAVFRGVQHLALRHCQPGGCARSSRLVCKSSSTVAQSQRYAAGGQPMHTVPPPTGTGAGAGPELPKELATLQELVSQLSKKAMEESAGPQELREAVGSLAENLTRQVAAVALSAKPHGTSQLANTPGKSYLDYISTPKSSGSDSEGQDEEEIVEPTIPRSEVTAMRSALNRKLSESRVHNRFLQREIQYREDGLRDTKAVLVALLSEMKEVFGVVTDLTAAESFIPYGSISIASRPSILKEKMEGLTLVLEKQLQGVDAMRLREVPLVWFGMAEDVKVMGSFDGWTYGEQMSPEATGTMTRFSTILKVRPGRYEIKFLVDGEWRVAPEWPTEGHGMTENNILIVD